MKTIIAGSRDGVMYQDVCNALIRPDRDWTITEVVSGTARGVDTLGEQWANYWAVPVTQFPADWDSYKKAAGFIRNSAMAEYADALVAVWDGKSRGTEHMIETARRMGLKVVVHVFTPAPIVVPMPNIRGL